MLGKTAGGLFWMFRYLERAENTARLVEAGWRIALTRSGDTENEWESVVTTAGMRTPYMGKYEDFEASHVINYLLRDPDNASSVMSAMNAARSNARLVRTALSSEVWEAVNECWMAVKAALARPVTERNLPEVLSVIRTRSAVVRGALHGTMLRNEIYNFCRMGTFLERSDNTARILDVKYYVLLPSASFVGSSMDNAQWENILRSVSAERSFSWLHGGETTPQGIAQFLILDRRVPRSMAFCCSKTREQLAHLEGEYGTRQPSQDMADRMCARFNQPITAIFDEGLHEFLEASIRDTAALASQIEHDFRFYG
ncbi:MAG: alpha-E domain-containing protein [Rhodobacterales bacterium]|nr:alpha-E domain-containing protein [Rhodobacterales bacterium]MDX5413297.1 alpha-E domain-containing protein [Rhodobacterales bacterium]